MSTSTPPAEPQDSATDPTPVTTSDPQPVTTEDNISASQPVVRISLLLTTGTRHSLNLSRNSLKKRGMLPDDNDPYSLTVFQLKQMIYNDWKQDWSERPASPSHIRLIFFGSLLVDTHQLRDTRFSHTESNVVHMTVKPAEVFDEDEKITSAKSTGSNTRRSAPGCCVIL